MKFEKCHEMPSADGVDDFFDTSASFYSYMLPKLFGRQDLKIIKIIVVLENYEKFSLSYRN
jgi:hypothetical protein